MVDLLMQVFECGVVELGRVCEDQTFASAFVRSDQNLRLRRNSCMRLRLDKRDWTRQSGSKSLLVISLNVVRGQNLNISICHEYVNFTIKYFSFNIVLKCQTSFINDHMNMLYFH